MRGYYGDLTTIHPNKSFCDSMIIESQNRINNLEIERKEREHERIMRLNRINGNK
jgi:hypothetical protein